MSSSLLPWSLTSALAGFLFGFETVVISGAEKTIQTVWGLSDELHGLAVGAALWGTVLGAFLGGWPTEKYGRKKTLIAIGMLYFVSADWSGLATDVYSFMIARYIGGIGVGVSTIPAPMYISEIAPPGSRGRLAGIFQLNIVFGILAGFLSNTLLAGISEHDSRWMLGVEHFRLYLHRPLLEPFELVGPRKVIPRGVRGKLVTGMAVLGQLHIHLTCRIVEPCDRGAIHLMLVQCGKREPTEFIVSNGAGHRRPACDCWKSTCARRSGTKTSFCNRWRWPAR